jgi:hypothetical protein
MRTDVSSTVEAESSRTTIEVGDGVVVVDVVGWVDGVPDGCPVVDDVGVGAVVDDDGVGAVVDGVAGVVGDPLGAGVVGPLLGAPEASAGAAPSPVWTGTSGLAAASSWRPPATAGPRLSAATLAMVAAAPAPTPSAWPMSGPGRIRRS